MIFECQNTMATVSMPVLKPILLGFTSRILVVSCAWLLRGDSGEDFSVVALGLGAPPPTRPHCAMASGQIRCARRLNSRTLKAPRSFPF